MPRELTRTTTNPIDHFCKMHQILFDAFPIDAEFEEYIASITKDDWLHCITNNKDITYRFVMNMLNRQLEFDTPTTPFSHDINHCVIAFMDKCNESGVDMHGMLTLINYEHNEELLKIPCIRYIIADLQKSSSVDADLDTIKVEKELVKNHGTSFEDYMYRMAYVNTVYQAHDCSKVSSSKPVIGDVDTLNIPTDGLD